MKNFQKLIAVSMLAISITSCQKTPEASFTTDKSEYVAGETINLTNTTLNGKTYKWTFPDGQTGSSESYAFETNDNDPAGTLTFRLEAFSSNGKKTDEVSKSVNIKAAEGDVVFSYGLDYFFIWCLGKDKEDKYAVIDFIKCINPKTNESNREIYKLESIDESVKKWKIIRFELYN